MKTFLLLLLVCVGSSLRAGAASLEDVLRELHKGPFDPVPKEELKKMLPSLTKTNEQELGVTVYGLACLLHDDFVGAQAAHDSLAKRYPHSAYLEVFNFDSLATKCSRCNGDGKTQTALCDRCKGGRRCVACGGKGRLMLIPGKNANVTQCPDCGGGGRCRNCVGTGRTAEKCEQCKGRGQILRDGIVRETMHSLLSNYRDKQVPKKKKRDE